MDRDTIFISHASPDDNDFVRWLGDELTSRGYTVWADVFHLKGGTPFWTAIEDALRNRAVKVIFVVSRRSVDSARSGVRNELSVADGLRKALKDPGFIVPVRIDDTPYDELPIQVHQLNTLDFSADWNLRLPDLLDTLEAATVPRTAFAAHTELAPPLTPAVKADGETTFSAKVVRPSLAVLPFVTLSNDPEQDYFADGLVEDIITALSRFRTFAVIARNSSFVYKGRAVDVRQVSRELDVRYVLEGSVRRSGNRVRVTAQLIDGASGAHLWAETFDGAIADIFDYQDRITRSAIGLIEPQIRRAEIDRARRKRPDSIDAWDVYVQALPLASSPSAANNLEAAALLDRAIAIDPAYAPALALAAFVREKQINRGAMFARGDEATACLALAERAFAADPDDPIVIGLVGWLRICFRRDYSGLQLCLHAAALNPNSTLVLYLATIANTFAGDLDQTIAYATRAIELSPMSPDTYVCMHQIAAAHLFSGRFEEALDWARRSIEANDGLAVAYNTVAIACVHLDRLADARAAVKMALKLRPNLTVAASAGNNPMRFPERLEIWTSGLRKAGMPEG